MTRWLKALLSQTIVSAWWILSALSTISTFFFPSWGGRWRPVLASSAIVGFAWANFRVFRNQQIRISTLELAQQVQENRQEARGSELIVTPHESRYILQPVGDLRHADFAGGHFEFHLVIENRGQRNSIVNNYRVEVVELRRTFPDLQPLEGRHGAQGRHSHQGLNPQNILSQNGMIQIDAESAVGRGTLLFFIAGINMEEFVTAGLRMQGPERMFEPLTCRLTLTDTTQSSATCEFQVTEA